MTTTLKACLKCNGRGRITQTAYILASGEPCMKTDAGAIEVKVDRGQCSACKGRKFLTPAEYEKVGYALQQQRLAWRAAQATVPELSPEAASLTDTDPVF